MKTTTRRTTKPPVDTRTPEQKEADRQANMAAATAKAEALITTPAPRPNVVTFDDYCTLRAAFWHRSEDFRIGILKDLAYAFEAVETDLAAHIKSMQYEAERIAQYGIAAVYESLTSGSRWHDLGANAAKVRTLVSLLGTMTRRLDDPEANLIDRFIHARFNG